MKNYPKIKSCLEFAEGLSREIAHFKEAEALLWAVFFQIDQDLPINEELRHRLLDHFGINEDE